MTFRFQPQAPQIISHIFLWTSTGYYFVKKNSNNNNNNNWPLLISKGLIFIWETTWNSGFICHINMLLCYSLYLSCDYNSEAGVSVATWQVVFILNSTWPECGMRHILGDINQLFTTCEKWDSALRLEDFVLFSSQLIWTTHPVSIWAFRRGRTWSEIHKVCKSLWLKYRYPWLCNIYSWSGLKGDYARI